MWKTLLNTWKKDDLLSQAWNDCYQALGLSREMVHESVRLLREPDYMAESRPIRQTDKQINKFQREIRRKVITHCTLRGSAHLPGGLVLVSIIIDVERIGDNAKNILDLARTLDGKLHVPACEETLAAIETDIHERFQEMVHTLKDHEIERAREIMNRHRQTTRHACDHLIDDLVKGTVDGLTSAESAALALYLRYLKRISAHLKNIATSVVNPFDRIGFKEKKTNE